MISSLLPSLFRVTLFWYVLGVLVFFIGDPAWAEAVYQRLMLYPGVPEMVMHGLATSIKVQRNLLVFWTAPMLLLWGVSLLAGWGIASFRFIHLKKLGLKRLAPRGSFCGVHVTSRSVGHLPEPTTPKLTGCPVEISSNSSAPADVTHVQVAPALMEVFDSLTAKERQLCEEMLQLLVAEPNHFAGLGHGVGLLEHTLNVVTEAATKCTPEFRLPLLAALAHDLGKLITFRKNEEGEWVRKGLHTRETARILATLPGFQGLPERHRRALLLTVKYDHAPSRLPVLQDDQEATRLAMRTIAALSASDKQATSDEKTRNIEKLQPEDLLWEDFKTFLRDAPVATRGKKGVANQVNNPANSPYLFIYEAAWRDEAVRRLPPEVAAALDLTRRDPGKLAKYTHILVERLRKEGLLVESVGEMASAPGNPLWDIQAGIGEKSVVFRGVLVLNADKLWHTVNYRLSVKSPFEVTILAPNADPSGAVRPPPKPREPERSELEVNDQLELNDEMRKVIETSILVDDVSSARGPRRRKSITGAKPAPAPSEAAEASSVPTTDSTKEGQLDLTMEPAPAAADPSPVEEQAPASDEVVPVEDLPDAEAAPSNLATALDAVEERQAPDIEADVPAENEPPAQQTPIATSDTRASGMSSGPTPSALSMAERRHGIGLADESACARYPGLKPGMKYYTERSSAVQNGEVAPGTPFGHGRQSKPATPPSTSSAPILSKQGPRRRKPGAASAAQPKA